MIETLPSKEQMDQIIIIHKSIMDLFLRQEDPEELIALYLFYYYTAKWQKTNQPKCTTEYVAGGLRWGIQKVQKVKSRLIHLGLIQDIAPRKGGKIT